MSAEIRAAIADAANSYLAPPPSTEKRVTPYYRQTTTAGWGWVSMGPSNRDDTGFGFMDTWEIRIVLSQEIAKAEAWIDEHRDGLTAAISEHLVVTTVTPAVLNLDNKTTVNALIIEGVREH